MYTASPESEKDVVMQLQFRLLRLHRELLEDTNPVLCPSQGLRLHGCPLLVHHALKALELLLHLVFRLLGPLNDEVLLLVRAALLRIVDVAEGCSACLFHVLLHVLGLGTQLVAHSCAGFLIVLLATIARRFIEVTDRRPATSPRALLCSVDCANLVRRE